MGIKPLRTMLASIRHRPAPTVGGADLPEALPASLVNRLTAWVFQGIINRFYQLTPSTRTGQVIRKWTEHYGADPDWRVRTSRRRQMTTALTPSEKAVVPDGTEQPIRLYLNLKSYRSEGRARYSAKTDAISVYLQSCTTTRAVTSGGKPRHSSVRDFLSDMVVYFLHLPDLIAHELTHCFEQRLPDGTLNRTWTDDELFPNLNELAARISAFCQLRGTLQPSTVRILLGECEMYRGFGRSAAGAFFQKPLAEIDRSEPHERNYIQKRLKGWVKQTGLVYRSRTNRDAETRKSVQR